MKILLLGRNGQVGRELAPSLALAGEVHAPGSAELNIANLSLLAQTIKQLKPDVIINAAAYTDVDRAESEPDLAMQINGIAPGVIAETARLIDAIVVHYSTDYLFDGRKGSPYTEQDSPNPLSVYGRTKLAGEEAVQAASGAHLILRTSWVYSQGGNNFVTKVLHRARRRETMRVVVDQISSPTWARLLASATVRVVARGRDFLQESSGLYHLACAGHVSRFEWAQMILELDPRRTEQTIREILPARSTDFHTAADRPSCSALDCDRAAARLGVRLPPWTDALQRALAEW